MMMMTVLILTLGIIKGIIIGITREGVRLMSMLRLSDHLRVQFLAIILKEVGRSLPWLRVMVRSTCY